MPSTIMYKWTEEMIELVKLYRFRNGLLQSDFIKELGISEGSWYHLKDKGLSVNIYQRLCGLIPEFKNVTLVRHE